MADEILDNFDPFTAAMQAVKTRALARALASRRLGGPTAAGAPPAGPDLPRLQQALVSPAMSARPAALAAQIEAPPAPPQAPEVPSTPPGGGGDSDEADPMAAIQQALARRQGAGMLAALSGDRVLGALGQQMMRGADEARAAQLANEAARTSAYQQATQSAAEQAKAAEERRRAQQALDASMADANRRKKEAEAALAEAKAKRAAHPGPHKATPAERRQTMRENALKERAGFEKIDPEGMVFRDAAQGKKFDDVVSATGALMNHRQHIAKALEQLKNAKSLKEADTALGVINQQMGALANRLRQAEQANNSDRSNDLIEGMLSMSHGTVANTKNLLNSGRLDEILNSAIESGVTNLDSAAQSANLRRIPGFMDDWRTWNPRGGSKGGGHGEAAAGGKQLSAQDKAALDWAKANPDSPDAKAILKHLGME